MSDFHFVLAWFVTGLLVGFILDTLYNNPKEPNRVGFYIVGVFFGIVGLGLLVLYVIVKVLSWPLMKLADLINRIRSR